MARSMLATAFALVFSFSYVSAQQRGELVEDLFRSFFESQLRPGAPSNHQPIGNLPPGTGTPNAGAGQLQAFQSEYGLLHREIESISHQLNQESRDVGALRGIMGDTWKVKGHADALRNSTGYYRTLAEIRGPYCDLDAQWRNLSYRLRNIDGLSRQSASALTNIDARATRLCKMLGVAPQFDRNRLVELTVMAATHLEDLLDDLQFDHPTHPNFEKLMHDGRILQEQLRSESQHARSYPYDDIVSRFSQFIPELRSYSGRIYQLKNARLNRRLARIRHCDAEVFEVLWITPPSDREYLTHLADDYQQRVDAVLNAISAKMLMALPSDQRSTILQLTDSISRQSQRLGQSVANHRPYDVLRTDFRQLDNDWNSLQQRVQRDSANPVSIACNELGQCHDEFAELIRFRRTINYAQAIHMAAAAENLALRLHHDLVNVAGRFRDRNYQIALTRASDTFYQRCRILYSQLSHHDSAQQLNTTMSGFISDWQNLSRQIDALRQSKLERSRTQSIEATYQELAPNVAQLASMLSV